MKESKQLLTLDQPLRIASQTSRQYRETYTIPSIPSSRTRSSLSPLSPFFFSPHSRLHISSRLRASYNDMLCAFKYHIILGQASSISQVELLSFLRTFRFRPYSSPPLQPQISGASVRPVFVYYRDSRCFVALHVAAASLLCFCDPTLLCRTLYVHLVSASKADLWTTTNRSDNSQAYKAEALSRGGKCQADGCEREEIPWRSSECWIDQTLGKADER